MEHPVTANRISGLIYWFFPVAVGIIQAVFNSYYQILPVTVAFIDGLTFYLVLGLLGIAVWYVVRYNDPEKSAVIQIFASHVAASVVFTSLWIVSSGIIVKILINNPLYDQYLNDLIPERIIGGIIYYVLLVSIYYTYVYSQHNREKQLREAEWQHQIRKTQLSALKSVSYTHLTLPTKR